MASPSSEELAPPTNSRVRDLVCKWLRDRHLDCSLLRPWAKLLLDSWLSETVWDDRCLLLYTARLQGNLLHGNRWLLFVHMVHNSLFLLRLKVPVIKSSKSGRVWEKERLHQITLWFSSKTHAHFRSNIYSFLMEILNIHKLIQLSPIFKFQ